MLRSLWKQSRKTSPLIQNTQLSSQFLLNNEPVRNLLSVQSRVADCAHEQQTFFEVNLDHVVHQWQRWRELLPRVRPFYAVKCQPDARITRILASLGCGFDCASREELHLALTSIREAVENASQGADHVNDTASLASDLATNSIVFANPFKFQQDMKYAQENQIQVTTFDSEGELYRIKKYWPTAKLIIRVSTRKKFDAKCQLGEKFGAKFSHAESLVLKAKELGFSIIGVSFHVGSMCSDFAAWPDTVEHCHQLTNRMRELGLQPWILDIGGGFPGLSSIVSEEEQQLQAEFEQMTRELSSALDTFYPLNDVVTEDGRPFTVISEPGTFFVHGSFTLATEVIGKRELRKHEYFVEFADVNQVDCSDAIVKSGSIDWFRFTDPKHLGKVTLNGGVIDDSKRFVYILDDGVYGSFNALQFMLYKFPMVGILNPDSTIKNLDNLKPCHICKIYGPTCDLLDCITKRSELIEIDVGDWLVWADMGAYTNATRSDFNGITRPLLFYHVSHEILRFIEHKGCDLVTEGVLDVGIGFSRTPDAS